MSRTKRKLCRPRLPMQRQLPLEYEGKHFNLKAVFDKLNTKYFSRRLRGYKIVWGRRRKLAPKDYFIFGTIQEDDRVIRIHPRLDAGFVPQWFLEYIVFHEMLHSVVPDKVHPASGRRIVHTEEFCEREKKFRQYRKARRWEDANLARFLR